MPETVVVLLESVEVEHHQPNRMLDGRVLHRPLEIQHQLAAIAEPGEGVGEGLVAAAREQAYVLAERDGHAHDHRRKSGDRERERESVLRLERLIGEQCQSGDRECGRHQQHAPAVEADCLGLDRLDPGGEAEHQRGRGPERGDDRRSRHAAGRGLVQEVAVDDGACHEAGSDHRQRPTRTPAGEREDGDHEAEQE